jgi:photosystem II stability/assembly factor-like uncharacterized protein
MAVRERLVALLTLALVAWLSACGDDDSSSLEPPSSGAVAAGPEHIHGLGVNPADGSLMIATHSGLFRAPAGSASAERVGDRRQDTMGFTVVGPDHFLGSGHPDLRDDLPPLLGLIRSEDAGRSWEPVSLLGRADFHVLRSVRSRIYGVNAADGELLVSDDGGLTWAARTPSGELIDVAAAPDDPDHVVASGVDGMFVSRNAGTTWRPLRRARAGLLAWLRRDALFVIDRRGRVHRSDDAGESWTRTGDAGGAPAALASHGFDLYVALHTSDVKMSSDGGRTWRLRVEP